MPKPADPSKKSGYINREQSWVEFNARVLSEAQNPRVPLLERLKFIAIVSSNFDEFFMVRVASVLREARGGDAGRASSRPRRTAPPTRVPRAG
jgi:polyphosphate kinase